MVPHQFFFSRFFHSACPLLVNLSWTIPGSALISISCTLAQGTSIRGRPVLETLELGRTVLPRLWPGFFPACLCTMVRGHKRWGWKMRKHGQGSKRGVTIMVPPTVHISQSRYVY
ncbi:hypothetical protein V8F33_004072 [Rhypophila sp. PSN 637]